MPVSRQGVPRSLGSRPRFVRDNLIPRTIYLPASVLERIERGRPPELIAVLTVLLADYLKGGV